MWLDKVKEYKAIKEGDPTYHIRLRDMLGQGAFNERCPVSLILRTPKAKTEGEMKAMLNTVKAALQEVVFELAPMFLAPETSKNTRGWHRCLEHLCWLYGFKVFKNNCKQAYQAA